MHAATGKLYTVTKGKGYKTREWRYELINRTNPHACMQLRAQANQGEGVKRAGEWKYELTNQTPMHAAIRASYELINQTPMHGIACSYGQANEGEGPEGVKRGNGDMN